jgi:hypothetical protein
MSDERLYVNGISSATGEYLVPPLTVEEAAALARGQALGSGILAGFKRIADRVTKQFLDLLDRPDKLRGLTCVLSPTSFPGNNCSRAEGEKKYRAFEAAAAHRGTASTGNGFGRGDRPERAMLKTDSGLAGLGCLSGHSQGGMSR